MGSSIIPYQIPNVGSLGVIQDPGLGGTLASGLAQVLAAQQAQQEQQYREQQLQQAQAQQQMMAQYYQGQLAATNRGLDIQQSETDQKIQGQRQVGGAQRAALGLNAPATPMQQPVDTVGNTTQQQPPGVFKQVLGGGAQALAPAAGNAEIFGGVSDENMGAAVKGVQEVQQLSAQPELPTSAKEFEYFSRLAQRDPQLAAIYKTLWLDPKPSTVINNIPQKGEGAFSEEWGKAQVGVLMQGTKDANTAASAFPSLNEAYGLVGKSFTGFGAKQKLLAARIARFAGVADADKVADTQTLLKLTGDQVLTYLRSRDLGSGNAVSNQDRDFMEQLSGRDISQDPSTLKRVLRINVGSGIMRQQEAINDLRDQAIAFPQNAKQLNQRAEALERKLRPIRQRYAEMLQDEHAANPYPENPYRPQ